MQIFIFVYFRYTIQFIKWWKYDWIDQINILQVVFHPCMLGLYNPTMIALQTSLAS